MSEPFTYHTEIFAWKAADKASRPAYQVQDPHYHAAAFALAKSLGPVVGLKMTAWKKVAPADELAYLKTLEDLSPGYNKTVYPDRTEYAVRCTVKALAVANVGQLTPDAVYKGLLLTIIVKPGQAPSVVRQRWGVPIAGQSASTPFNAQAVIAAAEARVAAASKETTLLQVPVTNLGETTTIKNAQAGLPTVQIAKDSAQPADAPPIVCENGVCYVCPDCSVTPNASADAKAQEVTITQSKGGAPVCATLAGTVGPNKVYITGACTIPAAQDRNGTLPSDAAAPGSSPIANAYTAPTTATGTPPKIVPTPATPSWIPYAMLGLALWRTFAKD